jgi:hypothetical protein
VIFDILLPLLMEVKTVRNEIFAVTVALRAGLVFSTIPVAMIYWRWLFFENIKK